MNKTLFGVMGVLVPVALLVSISSLAQDDAPAIEFPVAPILFANDPFNSCEGIGFNGQGQMFATCNRALWRIDTSAEATLIAELDSNLGVAGVGDEDVLVADFGPTNAFRDDRNSDGIVWRITPEGEKSKHALGIGDPNFILVRSDGSYLVSDDATSDIYLVQPDGTVSLYTTAVNHPNGMVLSLDETNLYVAQMFSNIRPVVGVNLIWAIKLEDGVPARDARLVTATGPEAFVDGLAMDELGRVYVAANREGRIWRFDPESEELIIIAEGVFGAASLAFGEGDFDRESLYVTTTFSQGRGGKIWQIPVAVEGAPLHR